MLNDINKSLDSHIKWPLEEIFFYVFKKKVGVFKGEAPWSLDWKFVRAPLRQCNYIIH